VNIPVAAAVVLIAMRHVPESSDPDAGRAGHLDVLGAALAVLGLGALTNALTALGGAGGVGSGLAVAVSGLVGVAALAAFLLVERRSPNPLVPLSLFADPLFSAANLLTLLIYGALGVYFLLLVLQLQTVAGFSPTAAGAALLPVTVLMLLLSARSGALADRIGPRPQLAVGPLLAAAGFLLALRIGPGANYLTDVLPAAGALGLGLATTVAPLTAAVLASADEHHAGIASGINNAVARSAGLLAVAVIPVAAGLAGIDYTDAAGYDAGFRRAMLIGAGLLVMASALAAVLVRPVRRTEALPATGAPQPTRVRLPECAHCPVTGPQLHPGPPSR
jgi:predicted MFS family arabinose efflux permease